MFSAGCTMNTGSKKLQREIGSAFCGAEVNVKGIWAETTAGRGIPEVSERAVSWETRSFPREHRRTNLALHATGTCRFCRSRLASQPDRQFEVRCKLRKVGENEIERLHRAMLVERDPESLRNLARRLTKALEERIKTLGEQGQPRPNN